MDPKQARTTYNRIGRFQDSQGFYEQGAIDELLGFLDLGSAARVIEIGCGTGKLARALLDYELPNNATYLGVDVSDTMVDLATKQLETDHTRAEARRLDITTSGPDDLGHADRIISTYVLDLLEPHQRETMIETAREIIEPNGLFGAVSITFGQSKIPAMVSTVWSTLANHVPSLVGGCRPISLVETMNGSGFAIEDHSTFSSWGITSEIIAARPK